jgi:translation initiation factor 1
VIDRGVPPERNARLVYSTGGTAPAKTETEPAGASQPTRNAAVRIRLERRASGRVATVVTGLPGPQKALAELARSLKAACGAGGTVKNGTLELQGDQRDAVEAALRTRGFSPKRAGG